MPRHTSMTPSTSRAPATAHFSMTPLTSRAPSTSTTPPPTPRASETTPPAPCAAAKPSSLSTTSTGHTFDIKCHCCHAVGHFQRDCPSKKSYIATDDGGYVSAIDVEDDFAL
jgi:cytochrome c5